MPCCLPGVRATSRVQSLPCLYPTPLRLVSPVTSNHDGDKRSAAQHMVATLTQADATAQWMQPVQGRAQDIRYLSDSSPMQWMWSLDRFRDERNSSISLLNDVDASSHEL